MQNLENTKLKAILEWNSLNTKNTLQILIYFHDKNNISLITIAKDNEFNNNIKEKAIVKIK